MSNITPPAFGSDNPGSRRVRWRSSDQLENTASHVFLPAHRGYTIPYYSVENNDLLLRAACATAHAYSEIVGGSFEPQWCCITKMLDNMQAFLHPRRLEKHYVMSQLRGMQTGDTLVFLNQAEDSAVIFTKQDHCTLYEFLKAPRDLHPTSKGLYRECATEIPDELFHNQCFQFELANFLLHLDIFPSHRNFSEDIATKPTRLLTSILRGVGRSTEVPFLIKHANSHYRRCLWHRSWFWFLVKGAIQICLRGGHGSICYKAFMLCFMCDLAKDAIDANLSSDLLHAISAKILRRFMKLGSSAPNWLRHIVVGTSASLREALEARWMEVEAVQLPSSYRNPSQLHLDRDTQLSFVQSKEHIRNSLTTPELKTLGSHFCPQHLPRGTLDDFLSSGKSFLEDAYRVDPYVTLYDVEQAVEQKIDDWVACVTDKGLACSQLATLMNKYLSSAQDTRKDNPEHLSIMLLTAIELWIALDKMIVEAVPMLNDHFPEVPIQLVHSLLLRKTTDLHRLRRAYQYLSTRLSQSLPIISMFSDEFIKTMFPDHHHTMRQHDLDSPEFWRLVEEHGIRSHVDSTASESQPPQFLNIWCTSSARFMRFVRWGISDNDFVYRLPSSSTLNPYIKATSHTSNDVLAAQADCPNDLSLHEFIAFGHLRSGGSLQWTNILRELRSRTLNFSRHDVYLLLTQVTSQVGPLDVKTADLEWHQELEELPFCYALLDELESLFVEVAVYSSNAVMMGIISFLLTRLLASSPCEGVEERAIELLQRVRRETFHWVRELSLTAPTDTERGNLVRDMAATCRSTFDVGPNILHKVLRSAEDVDTLLFCAVLVRVNSHVDPKSISGYSRLLFERDRHLSLAVEKVLREFALTDGTNRGIDLAIRNIWSGYCPGPRGWQALLRPNSHWLTCETAAGDTRLSQTVHLNLLDGTLLIDGKPIDALSGEIRRQALYKRIFGDQHFLVIPSDLPGMDFCSLIMISEYRLHFALRGGNLVIRARHKDAADILEAIPHEKLRGDLPTRFVDGHVHWLNLSTSIIEIRPFGKIWEQSPENWRVDCTSGEYRMYKGREWLVDIRSPSYKMVASRLGCLDDPENLIITTFPIDTPHFSPAQQLSAVLPRYGLSFFANENGELESRDFKNMVCDENQCIGTLFGLENRLVLRSRVQVDELIHRCIIIPEGQFSRSRYHHHVRVRIVPDGLFSQLASYHAYHVDTDFGCLTGYASWRSKLYLAHLHAETSVDWMPDPLTGRTGIQEALCLLRSAGCRSVMELDIRHGELPFSVDPNMYPQIKFALQEIEYLIKRQRFLHSSGSNPPSRPQLDVIHMQRTAYLFPSEVVCLMPVETNVKSQKFEPSEPEELAYIVSLAVYHWLVNVDSRLVPLPDTEPAHTPWPLPNLFSPSIVEVEALLQEAVEARQQCRLLFLLPTAVYCQRDPQPHFLSVLIALAKKLPLKNPPPYDEYQPSHRYSPSEDTLRRCLADAGCCSIPQDIVCNILRVWPTSETSPLRVISRNDRLYDVKGLSRPFSPMISVDGDVHVAERLNTGLQALFSSCYRNLKLKEDLTRRLTEIHALQVPCPPPLSHTLWPSSRLPQQLTGLSFEPHSRMPWQVTLGQLLYHRCTPNISAPIQLRRCGSEGDRLPSPSSTRTLNQLLASFRFDRAVPSFQQYISRLHDSVHHVPEAPHMRYGTIERPPVEELETHYMQCRLSYVDSLIKLKAQLGPTDDTLQQVLQRSGQWPQITPDTLFRCLASTSATKLPGDWKKCLLSLALLLLEYQRARRLLRFAMDDLEEELSRELENVGCDGWRAEEYLDWLLIQLQGNFLIRGIQAHAAMKMISPPSERNTAMQVNMGEGKSSVILPISAAALADGNQLVRVIAPKALTVQMFQLLVHRLGGFINRPIYHLAFSRSLTGRYDKGQFEILRELLSECMRNRGILVVQPEHVLSLKLTSVEQQLPTNLSGNDKNSHQESRNALLELQRWFDSCSRDILDESDEVLRPRFQLMYAIGPRQHMEGYPNRWTITQQVLRLVKKRTLSLSRALGDAIEYERSSSESFPHIRISRDSDARRLLISLIAKDVMDGHLPGFRFRDISDDQQLRDAVRDFISSKEVSKQTASMVEEYARKSRLWDGTLLLRGLLACDVLLFALAERRWRVDYGLSPSRTMLAVPYRAKDVPSPAAEFGHPDITIVLTCLSHYYGGLTEEQLRASFKLLQEQDDASTEYANWLREHNPHSVPESIQNLRNVNIKSLDQWNKYLFPLFARNQGAVDFYLSQIVFPREASEFPWKLAVSSWDLVEMRQRPITGFSGTNDGQYLLPTSITQCELDHQLGANAKVLAHILQAENNFYTLISGTNGERRTTSDLLKLVVNQKPEIHVFLDVGAQILDLSNYQVAKVWLDLSSDCDGAIYFNEDDELMVLTKDGISRSLLSSPLAQRLDRCVVYLDDAHTRGTDLKLPSCSRAAVTLGPKVTKDRLAQGCMRMRKLGRGHSVMFLVPLEVDRSIRVVAAKEDLDVQVTATDILRWAIHETWTDIQQQAPYWAQQGINHNSRYEAWSRFCSDGATHKQFHLSRNKAARKLLADAWLQPELKSLADLYAPFKSKNVTGSLSILSDPRIQQRCITLGVVRLPEAQMDEEQEREVNREIEREREVQRRPPNASPASHSLHPDIVTFVRTGFLPLLRTGSTFHPVFTALEGSSAATTNASVWSPLILATSDFCKTIEPPSRPEEMDQFLRPVQWVLSGKGHYDRVLVVLSPFEADRLMPDIRVSDYVHLHVYTPRTSERMRPADDLMLYSIPPVPDNWSPPWDLIDQLNVFAGQPYLRDYESYLRLRRLLDIQGKNLGKNIGTAVLHNLVTAGVLEDIRNTLTDSPLSSAMKLLVIRRRGLPFAESHMGRILQGQQLTEKDFENVTWAKPASLTHPRSPKRGLETAQH